MICEPLDGKYLPMSDFATFPLCAVRIVGQGRLKHLSWLGAILRRVMVFYAVIHLSRYECQSLSNCESRCAPTRLAE